MSADGNRAVFSTTGTNLVKAPGEVVADKIMVYDYQRDSLRPISVTPEGAWLPKLRYSTSPTMLILPTPALSLDGRWALFQSHAQGLESGGTISFNSTYNFIYLRDLENDTVHLASASVNPDGTTNLCSYFPGLSADGRWVVFAAQPRNASGTYLRRVFLRDMQARATTCISTQIARIWPEFAEGGFSYHSYYPQITPDGRHVVFLTACYSGSNAREIWRYDRVEDAITLISTNLPAPHGTSRQLYSLPLASADGRKILHGDGTHLWIWEEETGASRMVDAAWDGAGAGNGEALHAALSADGSRVVFISNSTNLVPQTAGQTQGYYQIYVHDLATAATCLISTNAAGELYSDYLHCWPALSPDGRLVAFASTDPSLVEGDNNHESDLFLKDLASGELRLVSRAMPERPSSAALGAGYGPGAALSQDGRYLAVVAGDGELVPGDANGFYDVVVLDRQTGNRRLASAGADGAPGNHDATHPSISADGQQVLFVSRSANLFSHDPAIIAPEPGGGLFLPVTQYVYVHDAGTSNTVLAATNICTANLTIPQLSPDGRYVVYASTDTNLVQGIAFPEGASYDQIYLYDLWQATNRLVTFHAVSNTASAAHAWGARFSPDGQWLLFHSSDRELDPERMASTTYALYLYDIAGQSLRLLASASSPRELAQAAFSLNSKWVAMATLTSNILHHVENGAHDFQDAYAITSPVLNSNATLLAYFSYDQAGTGRRRLQLCEVATGSTQTLVDWFSDSNDPWRSPRLLGFAGHDRFLVFQTLQAMSASDADNLTDVYVFDLVASNLTLLAVPSKEMGNAIPPITAPMLSHDRQWLAFNSTVALDGEPDFNPGTDWYRLRFIGENGEPLLPDPVYAPDQSHGVAAGGGTFFAVWPLTTAPLSFQWFKDGVALAEDERLSGVNASRLILSQAATADDGQYSVLVSNAWQSLVVPVGRLSVLYPPWVNTIYGVAVVEESEGRKFSLSIQVNPGLRYQVLSKPDLQDGPWLPEGNPVTATGAVLRLLLDLSPEPQRYYRVQQLP